MKRLLWVALLLPLSSCGYRLGEGAVIAPYSTISIPYAGGDENGQFTAVLVKKMSASGTLRYCRAGGELILNVNIQKVRNKNIGFRYDRDGEDCREPTIVPTETRRIVTAEVAVVEACSGRVVLGPVILSEFVEFDHAYYTTPDAVNVFSLGQLVDIESAYDAAWTPLYEKFAEKIVDYVINSY